MSMSSIGDLQALEIPLASTFFIRSLKELIVPCFQVKAKYKGAKDCKGVRAAVYKCAEEHQAQYSPLDRSKSIWYDGDSADLHIALWFKDENKACDFRCFLNTWYLKNPMIVKSGDFTVESDIVKIHVEADELSPVLFHQYDAIGSLEDFQGCLLSVAQSSASALSLSSPVALFQSIERPELFDNLCPVKAHIKSKAACENSDYDPDAKVSLIIDENNLLGLSRDFHDFFDGTMTYDVDTGLHDVPLIAIKQEGDIFQEEVVGSPPLKRKRVELVVECRNDSVGEVVAKRLKLNSKKLSATKFRTHIHVANPSITCACLDWKYKETCSIWDAHDDN